MTLLGGPPPPSLRSAQGPSSWRPEVFLHAMRTGVLPGGDTLDPRFMPWLAYRALSDLQLRSIGLYLRKDSSPFEPDQATGTGQPH